jgi:hypothetical protein
MKRGVDVAVVITTKVTASHGNAKWRGAGD